MSIWARMFGSPQTPPFDAQPSGLVEDEGGWYYEESRDIASSRLTIRIEQDRPGDWYVHEGFCEVEGLDDPRRAEEVERFFSGSYRWLELERRSNEPNGSPTIVVVGTSRDGEGDTQRAALGFVKKSLALELGDQNIQRLWAKLRSIQFRGRGRKTGYSICFDLMVELDKDLFE